MIVVGLTGSIAMGKSTVAQMFGAIGWPVFDADAAVHDFYRSAGAASMESIFPGVVVDGVVDRGRLAEIVLGDSAAIRRLEAIVHPAVAAVRGDFLRNAGAARRRGVFLDIPLLLETGGEASVDVIVVVSATRENQRERALSRAGMSAEKFLSILSRQLSDEEKRRRAHFIIDTNGSLADTRRQAEDFVQAILSLPGRRGESALHA